MFVIGKAKTPLRLNSVKVYSVVTKIKGWMDGWIIAWRVSQRDELEIFFWKKESCFSDRQLPCPSSNWELRIDEFIFPPTERNFSDSANGPGCDSLTENTVP